MTLLATHPVGLDVVQAVRRYRRLSSLLARTAVHYAVRADPHPELLEALAEAQCKFDVTDAGEVGSCLAAGATPDDLVFSAAGSARDDLCAAAGLGVHLFVVSSPEDVCNVALAAPGSSVLYRSVSAGHAAGRRVARSLDRSSQQAVLALRQAAASGLEAAGLSWRVGAQRRDPHAWRAPISASARTFTELRAEGLRPWVLDLGGGLLAAREDGTPPLALYAASIDRALHQEFGVARPRTLVSAGRALVG